MAWEYHSRGNRGSCKWRQAMTVPPLASTEWLAEHLADENVRVADVRWYLPTTGKNGYDEYLKGHIPGAVFLDLDRDLAAPPEHGPGRHPLPAPADFAQVMAKAGIGPETHVVAYDNTGGSTAA